MASSADSTAVPSSTFIHSNPHFSAHIPLQRPVFHHSYPPPSCVAVAQSLRQYRLLATTAYHYQAHIRPLQLTPQPHRATSNNGTPQAQRPSPTSSHAFQHQTRDEESSDIRETNRSRPYHECCRQWRRGFRTRYRRDNDNF